MAETTLEKVNDSNTELEQAREELTNAVAPAVDIYEKDEQLVIEADMPGIDRDSIHVSTEKGILTIKGVGKEVAERDYTWREFVQPSYFRQFRLSEKINKDKINAEYCNGVLTVTLPFAEEVKPRKIDVKVS